MVSEILDEVDNHLRRNRLKTRRKKGSRRARSSGEVNYYPNCDASIWVRSCDREVLQPLSGRTTGAIPEWLSGTLLRNGPGSIKVGDCEFDHLFDSSALLHRFHVSAGVVTYQRRFVQTNVFRRNQHARRIVMTEFGTRAAPDPCQTIFKRIAAAFNPEACMSDNSMISVYPFGDEFYTFAEAPFVHQIDPQTLETKKRIHVSDYVGVVNHTSHPHVMDDGTVYNVGTSITLTGPAYSVVRFPPKSRTEDDNRNDQKSMFEGASIVASIPARWKFNPSYMHTFGITDNYFIIVEQPLAVAALNVLTCKIKNKPLCTALKWHDSENTLIHVVCRKTGQLRRTFTAAPFFFLHIINQYESANGDNITLDICCYRDAKMLDCMYVDAMRNIQKNPDYSRLFRGRPLRFVLPMTEAFSEVARQSERILERRSSAHRQSDGSIFVSPELICNLGCETPQYNPDYQGKNYRYFYAISSDVDVANPGMVIKVDTLKKSAVTWGERDLYPSEPIFVGRPGARDEDDGVILSAAIHGRNRESDVCFLVIDARSMREIGRVSFNTPGAVPKCLHGWFVPEACQRDHNNNGKNAKAR